MPIFETPAIDIEREIPLNMIETQIAVDRLCRGLQDLVQKIPGKVQCDLGSWENGQRRLRAGKVLFANLSLTPAGEATMLHLAVGGTVVFLSRQAIWKGLDEAIKKMG